MYDFMLGLGHDWKGLSIVLFFCSALERTRCVRLTGHTGNTHICNCVCIYVYIYTVIHIPRHQHTSMSAHALLSSKAHTHNMDIF